MVQFVAVVEPSAIRRGQFLQSAMRELASFYGTAPRSIEVGDALCVYWAASWEPLSVDRTAQGVALVAGHAMRGGQRAGDRPEIGELWESLPRQMPRPLEGIHAALLFRSDGSWAAGADLLGTMPIYYHADGDYVIVGSSPELFSAHPSFRACLDPAGLIGILMTNGLVDGRSLLQGVRRLTAGNLLYGERGGAPREMLQYRPALSDSHFGSSYEDNLGRAQEALEDCFDRHLGADRRYGLILSGGLDSRLVAGIAVQRDIDVTAFSLGGREDIEMQCASGVARSLGLPQRIVPVRMQRYPEYAEDEIKWRHLANGFSGLPFFEALPEALPLHGGMLSGYAMEGVIGGDHIGWAGSEPADMSFDKLFLRVNRWGMPIETIKRLLAGMIAPALVDEVRSQLQQTYNDYADLEFHRSWVFGFYHRMRYHTSAVLGLHSRWPWPVVPYIDTRMLDLMGTMPYVHVRQRRMQYDLLRRRFPNLARVPLDRNAFNMKPVLPRYGRQLDRILYKLREAHYRWLARGADRRFYYRVFDFNSAGWTAVRNAAEPYRARALQVMDEATLSDILPQPNVPVTVRDGIIDASKAKLLTGFLLWSRDHL